MIENELQGLILLVIAALMGTFYAYVIKLSGNRLVLFASLNLVTIFIGLLLLPVVPVPEKESWPYLFAAALSYNVMLFWLIKAYERLDLSQLAPLRSGIQIFVVTFLSVFLDQEAAGWIAAIAFVFLIAGFVVQVPARQFFDPAQRTGLFFTLVMGVFSGLQLYFDFHGIRLSGDPLSYIVYTCFYGVPVVLLGFFVRRKEIVVQIRREKAHIFWGSFLDTAGYSLIIYTVFFLNVLYVLPVSNIGVVFATLVGLYLLKESFPARRLIGAVFIFASVVLIHFKDLA